MLFCSPVGAQKHSAQLKKGLTYSWTDNSYTYGWREEGSTARTLIDCRCASRSTSPHRAPRGRTRVAQRRVIARAGHHRRRSLPTAARCSTADGAFAATGHDSRRHPRAARSCRTRPVGIGTSAQGEEQEGRQARPDQLRKIEVRHQGDPALFDGGSILNRGIIEFIEVLKLDVHSLRPPGAGRNTDQAKICADRHRRRVIIGHNDPNTELQSNEFMEALRDRTEN